MKTHHHSHIYICENMCVRACVCLFVLLMATCPIEASRCVCQNMCVSTLSSGCNHSDSFHHSHALSAFLCVHWSFIVAPGLEKKCCVVLLMFSAFQSYSLILFFSLSLFLYFSKNANTHTHTLSLSVYLSLWLVCFMWLCMCTETEFKEETRVCVELLKRVLLSVERPVDVDFTTLDSQLWGHHHPLLSPRMLALPHTRTQHVWSMGDLFFFFSKAMWQARRALVCWCQGCWWMWRHPVVLSRVTIKHSLTGEFLAHVPQIFERSGCCTPDRAVCKGAGEEPNWWSGVFSGTTSASWPASIIATHQSSWSARMTSVCFLLNVTYLHCDSHVGRLFFLAGLLSEMITSVDPETKKENEELKSKLTALQQQVLFFALLWNS